MCNESIWEKKMNPSEKYQLDFLLNNFSYFKQ